MASFKDRFKELRKEKDLGQEDIGKILGYSESTISLYESGNREPKKIADLIKIATFFDVSLDYLTGKTDIKNSIIKNEDSSLNIKDITPKDKTEQLKDFLLSASYIESSKQLNSNDIKFITETIENYLKATNNFKQKDKN